MKEVIDKIVEASYGKAQWKCVVQKKQTPILTIMIFSNNARSRKTNRVHKQLRDMLKMDVEVFICRIDFQSKLFPEHSMYTIDWRVLEERDYAEIELFSYGSTNNIVVKRYKIDDSYDSTEDLKTLGEIFKKTEKRG